MTQKWYKKTQIQVAIVTGVFTALVAVMNDCRQVSKLDEFDIWKNQTPIALDASWP